MIYTLTLNTAIDMNILCNPVQPGVVNRTRNTAFSPNGKGVNVARVLNHFSEPAHILGIFGGFTGRYIVDELTTQAIAVTPVWVEPPTRINIFIHDGEQEYKLIQPGTFVDKACEQQILQVIEDLTDARCLVICGSLPPGPGNEFYPQILSVCRAKNIPVILDISHPSLRELLAYKPLLIKPNDDEVSAIFGLPVTNHQQAKIALKAMHSLGASNILLTLGARGLYFSDGLTQWFCTAPDVELISSACAGDAALGAFLSLWLRDGDVEAALKMASAAGADVASSAGLGELAAIEQLRQQVNVITL